MKRKSIWHAFDDRTIIGMPQYFGSDNERLCNFCLLPKSKHKPKPKLLTPKDGKRNE